MIEIILWMLTGFLSLGIISINYLYIKKKASLTWKVDKDPLYFPKTSVIIPTFNEEKIIKYKIQNIMKVDYPNNLIEFIFVDSLSSDSTLQIIRETTSSYPDKNIKILLDDEKKGKSNALNLALKYCSNEIVIISDADCFWPSKILVNSVTYLHDKEIGAITGPKILLNKESSWTTRGEDRYMNYLNLMKLGDSKTGSTIFFEGGFSAFRRDLIESFDPYNTGSDDCGTAVSIMERSYRTIMIPDAEFFTTFPESLSERITIKIRRSGQLLYLYKRYFFDLLRNKITIDRSIIAKYLLIYLFGPFFFMTFMFLSVFVFLQMPLLSLSFLILLIPRAREYSFELIFGYIIFFFSLIIIITKGKFLKWDRPEDRKLFTEEILIEKNLI